jgi:hypothetical protein
MAFLLKQAVAFLKKSSAKDFCFGAGVSNAPGPGSRSFLLLFFKKEALSLKTLSP